MRISENRSKLSLPMTSREEIIEVLKTIEDPELFLDIWFLGLIYKIEIEQAKVAIDMTFTTPMCPAGPMLIGQVSERVGELDGVDSVEVNVVFEPPWEPSDEVKGMLGML